MFRQSLPVLTCLLMYGLVVAADRPNIVVILSDDQ